MTVLAGYISILLQKHSVEQTFPLAGRAALLCLIPEGLFQTICVACERSWVSGTDSSLPRLLDSFGFQL